MSEFDTLPKTPNLNLNKPAYDNVADINALNENADILDTVITGVNTNLTNHFSNLQAHSNIFADVNFYVATTGSDSNNGAEGTPFKTIQKAVDSIPVGSKYAKINIANGTYNENVIKHNANGMQIELYGNTTTSVKTIALYGKCIVRIQNIILNSTTADLNCLVLSGVYAIIDSCTFNGVTTGKGVYLYGSTGMIRNCTFNNCQRGIYAVYGAEISTTGNSYSDNIIDIYANGGIIHTDDVATTSSENGGAVINKLMGKSLTTGVADSTTATTDSSKKLATTEWVNNQVVASSLTGTSKYVRYANGFTIMWITVNPIPALSSTNMWLPLTMKTMLGAFITPSYTTATTAQAVNLGFQYVHETLFNIHNTGTNASLPTTAVVYAMT